MIFGYTFHKSQLYVVVAQKLAESRLIRYFTKVNFTSPEQKPVTESTQLLDPLSHDNSKASLLSNLYVKANFGSDVE